MKKLIFLILILFTQLDHCTQQKTIAANRQNRLNEAVKTSNLTVIIGLIKNIKQHNDSMDIFNNNELLTEALKKFKNKKANLGNLVFRYLSFGLIISASFLAPYALFYYFYKDWTQAMQSPETISKFEAVSLISTIFTPCAFLSCLIYSIIKAEYRKEAKLIYKILKKHTVLNNNRKTNA